MEIRTLESESSLVVSIRGLLDTSHSQDLEKFIESKIGLGFRKFLLDLSLLESLSSGGIGFFIRILEKGKSSPRIFFAITGMNPEVQRLFRFFGLDKKLNHFKSLDSAKEYLKRINIPQSKPSTETIESKSYKPYKDKIQFYYKGQVSPSSYSYRKGIATKASVEASSVVKNSTLSETFEENSSHDAEPESHLEPIETEPNRQSFNPEQIIQRLESKMDELKQDVFTQSEAMERKIYSDIESKLIEWKQSENKIDSPPSISKTQKVESELHTDSIVLCESCGTQLRVRTKGKYKCPSCKMEFYYKGLKSMSYLEKLM